MVLEYQLQNTVENLADVSTRCSGLLQGENLGEGQSIWSKRRQGFQPCFEAGIPEPPFLMPEPAEKPSLHIGAYMVGSGDLSNYIHHYIYKETSNNIIVPNYFAALPSLLDI